MTESEETGTGDSDTVEDLLANCLQHARSEWKSVVDQLCADSPEHAEAVRNRVAALERCGLLSNDGLARTQQGSENPLSLSDSNGRLGRYRILKELGRGGQAVVYLAEDARLNRRVALKVLSGASEISDRALARFRREAHAVSRLDHPGICAVYEAETIDGTPTIAMRHIDGHSLREDITTIYSTLDPSLQTSEGDDFIDFNDEPEARAPKKDPTSTSHASHDDITRYVGIVEKIARALHVAHEGGLVHRDIKPGNIMITSDDDPVILDFGLAQDENATDVTLTQTGDLLGTPAYMSPEQLLVQRIPIDRRTDIYSLGVVLFETVAAQRPFDAPTRVQLYERILSSDPPDLKKLNPRIPTDLKVVIEVALQKNRDKRFQTAHDFAEELRRIRMQEPILSRRTPAAVRLVRWCRRHPTGALAAFLFVIIASLGAYSLGKGREASLERENHQLTEQEVVRIESERAALELSQRGRKFVDGLIDSHTDFGMFDDDNTIRGSVEGILDLYRDYGLPLETDRPVEELAREILDAIATDSLAGDYLCTSIYNLYSTMARLNLDQAAYIDTPNYHPEGATEAQLKTVRNLKEQYPQYMLLVKRITRLIDLIDNDPWRREMWRFFLRERTLHDGAFWEWSQEEELHQRPTSDLLLLISLFMSSADASSSVKMMAEGVKLMDQAISNAGQSQLDLLTAHLMRGMIQMGMVALSLIKIEPGNLSGAVRDFEICLVLQPQSPLLTVFLARMQLLNDDTEDAELTFQRSIALAKSADHTTFVKLIWGDALLRVGRNAEAATIFEELLASKPTANWYRIVGITRLAQEQTDEALKFLRLALDLEPDSGQIITDYAHALLSKGDWKASIVAANKSLAIDNRNINALVYLATANAQLEKHAEAVDAWTRLLNVSDAYGHLWVRKAQAQITLDDEIGGRATLAEAEKRFKTDSDTLMKIAGVFYSFSNAKDKDRAIDILKQAVQLEDSTYQTRRALLTGLHQMDRFQETIDYSRAFLGQPTETATTRPFSSSFEIERDPINRAKFLSVQALAFMRSNQPEAARDAFRDSVRLDPSSATCWNRLSTTLIQLRQIDPALAAARKAVAARENNAWHNKTLAIALFASGDLDAAETAFRKAIRLAAGITPEGSPSLIDLLWAQGKRDDSLDLARTRFEATKSVGAALSLINTQLQAYDFQTALATSRIALQLHPKSQQLIEYQGWGLLLMGRIQDALESFALGRTLDPKSKDTLRGIAMTQLMLGKADLAQRIAAKCLEFHPDSPNAQRSMAIVLTEQGRTLEAKTILSKSIAESPSEHSSHEQLGRVQMLLGNFEDATRSISSALELAKNDLFATDDVIVLQSQLQDLEEFDRLKFEILGLRTPATPAQSITVAIAAFHRGNYQRTLDLLESTVDDLSDAELETPRMAYCYEIAAEAAARILLGQGHKFEAAIASKAPDGTPILDTNGDPRYALTMGPPLPLPTLEFSKRPAMADLACHYLQEAITIRDEGAQDVDDSKAIATHRAHLSRLPINPGFSALIHPPSGSPWIESSQFVFDNIRQLLKDIGTL